MGRKNKRNQNPADEEQEEDEFMRRLEASFRKNNQNVFGSRIAEGNGSVEDDLRKAKEEVERLKKENKGLRETKVAESSRIEKEVEFDGIESDDLHKGATCSIQFRDLENTIPSFEGSGPYRVESWVDDFERISNLYNLNPLQRLSFATRSLRGTAEKAVKSATHISSWEDLKTYLKAEFSRKVSSADVHNQLRQRKKRREESLRDYLYEMRQLGSMGNVDDSSIISYIIDGIDDAPTNKILLYGVSSMTEFRERLFVYEEFKSKQAKPSTSSSNSVPTSQKSYIRQRCFNCGKAGHQSKNCYKKDEGPRCFKCQQFGHKAPECTKKSESYSKQKWQETKATNDKSCLANVGES